MSYPIALATFVGKVAVVSGASAGIGKSIAELLVKQGVIVAGIARRVQRVRLHARELIGEKGILHAFQCDLTKQDEILLTFKRITTELGPINILINNAGILKASDIINGDIVKWKAVIDTNVLAVAIAAREAVASMKAHIIKGHIININSVAGHLVPDFPQMGLYPSTKHAITALTETIRLEINREKLPIKITSVSPGYVDTEIIEKGFGQMPSGNAWDTVIGKGLQDKDVADAVLYVLSTPEHVNIKELTLTKLGARV